MINKKFFVLYSILIILIAALVLFIVFNNINFYRISMADSIYQKGLQEVDPQTKLIYFLQSYYLCPTIEKKYKIAESGLESGNYKFAKEYMETLDSTELVKELDIFLQFSKGNQEILNDLNNNPTTDLGWLLNSIKQRSYLNIPGHSSYVLQINQISSEYSDFEREYSVSNIFSSNNQYYISNYILNNMLKEHKCNVGIYTSISENYKNLGYINEAINTLESAVSCNTSNIDTINKIIEYTDIINDKEKNEIYKNRLKSLNLISQ